jgi:uncharacterized protein with GYD domain
LTGLVATRTDGRGSLHRTVGVRWDTTREKEGNMPRYVSLINFTEKGIGSYKDTVTRADAAKKAAADMGGSLEVMWTVGQYDLVAISEFPDDETATKFLLNVGAQGNIRTQTMRAFDASEMSRIVSG